MEQGMGKDEEVMDIYANTNPVNIHNVRTETENTRRHQTPQHTGSNCVTIRRYRVCLVLLCVLLLIAVIVLCVHIHTKNTNCTEENDGWVCHQSNLYLISSEKKNWTESRRYCTERGADLIIINNSEEQDFVKNITAKATVWIGLTDSDVEETWEWVDGSTLTSEFWDPREPNGQRRENCAITYSPGWADYPCSDLFSWICEKSRLK